MNARHRNIAIGIAVVVFIAGVVLAVVLTYGKSLGISSAEIIPCTTESCRNTVDINLTWNKKSKDAVVVPRRDNVMLAATTGYQIVDQNLDADTTYSYSISYGDSNIWSPVVTVVVDSYQTLCNKYPGTENFNGMCVPLCDAKSTRNLETGVCECTDPNATRDASGTCVCSENFEPGILAINGVAVCIPKCGPQSYRTSDGICACNTGYELVNNVCVANCKANSTRNYATGECACNTGYELFNNECVAVCINATRDASGTCICNAGYELYNGSCVPVCGPNFTRNANGQCICKDGYTGATCAYSDAITCNSHGTAQSDGSCVCATTYSGVNCEKCAPTYAGYPSCNYSDAITCNSHGTAQDNGTCVCATNYAGANCETCAPTYAGYPGCNYSNAITCSNNGTAMNDGSCTCSPGFIGTNCQYSNATTCNNHGTVNAVGQCTCAAEYTGANCELCAAGYVRNSSTNLCELALTIQSSQIAACTGADCANTVDITLSIAGPDQAPFKVMRNNEIILTGTVNGSVVPFNCLTATTPFGQAIKWNIFSSNFVRTFRPSVDTNYSYVLSLAAVDTNGYQWYKSDVTKTSGTTSAPVVELGLMKVPQGVNLKLRGLYSAGYGKNNSTVGETYAQMFTSNAPPFTVGAIPPFKITWTTTTATTVVYSPVSNKNAIINMSTNGVYETRTHTAGSYYWLDSVQQHKFISTSVPAVQMGIQVLSATSVQVVFVLSVYTVPYVADSTETVIEYPVLTVPARASTFSIVKTLTTTQTGISWTTQTSSVKQSTGTATRNFTIYQCDIPITFAPATPVYTYLNPMPVFISTIDKQNITGCFDLMSIDLGDNVRGGLGLSVPAVTLARDAISQLRRWQCDGSGACTQTSSSSTTSAYATKDECLCSTCNTSGVCASVVANTKGTLASCIGAKCALTIYGTDETAAPIELMSSLSRYHTRIKLTETSLYPGKVILAQNVVSTNGVPTIDSIGAVKFVGATYLTPRFIYYPMCIFTATKPWVTLNSNGARIVVDGGSGDDSSDISIVLVPWGNVTANLPDPVLFAATTTRTIQEVVKTVPVVTHVFANTTAVSRNGRGWSNYCAGFVNKKVQVTAGLQYAIAMQATVCTDDFVYMDWTGFAQDQNGVLTPAPAVTFSDV